VRGRERRELFGGDVPEELLKVLFLVEGITGLRPCAPYVGILMKDVAWERRLPPLITYLCRRWLRFSFYEPESERLVFVCRSLSLELKNSSLPGDLAVV
jgi:hypothetical protein